MKRTRIVATIGPASCSAQKLLKMIKDGMNVARLNFSHGTYEEHAKFIAAIRLAARRAKRTVTIMQDLSGPKVRVGELPPEGLVLEEGEKIIFSNNPKVKGAIPFGYTGLTRDVGRGDTILLDDGLLEVVVLNTTSTEISARVVVGGLLTSHKGMNVPSASLRIPAITEKDKRDLEFGLEHGVDWVALSFVRDPRDVQQLRTLITKHKPKHTPKIIAKIEKHEAIKHLVEIIHAADGIMIARGDLGVETPPESVPLVQKRIIKMCRAVNKPVIVATQMLDSMIRNPRPTRAEVSDVALAVFDGADATMLSAESASGKYPIEAVEMMARVIGAIENPDETHEAYVCDHTMFSDSDEMLSYLGTLASEFNHAKAIIISHKNIELAPLLAHFRPRAAIFAQVASESEGAQINFHFGVYPFRVRSLTDSHLVRSIVKEARAAGLVEAHDRIVILEKSKKEPFFSIREVEV